MPAAILKIASTILTAMPMPAAIKIVHRYLRLNHQFDGFKIIRAGLSLRPRGFNAAADPAPEINLVAETEGHINRFFLALRSFHESFHIVSNRCIG